MAEIPGLEMTSLKVNLEVSEMEITTTMIVVMVQDLVATKMEMETGMEMVARSTVGLEMMIPAASQTISQVETLLVVIQALLILLKVMEVHTRTETKMEVITREMAPVMLKLKVKRIPLLNLVLILPLNVL